MWYAKLYFSEGREIIQYDAAGMQGHPAEKVEFPFLESLLSFQELDCSEVTPKLQGIAANWERFIQHDDREAGTEAMAALGALSEGHIYLKLLYIRWYDRFCRVGQGHGLGSAEDQQLLEELRQLPKQLPLYQEQIRRFFDLVLDIDSAGRKPQAQAARKYTFDQPNDPDLFSFRPIPLSFEPVEPGRCSSVLYSSGIRDMIDYALRSCVERNITVRRCKNCGRWFPQMVRVSAEYCERPVPRGEQVCREIGAFKQWTIRQAGNDAFKAYRREYKRRFAWIRAGRITDEAFYAWSEKAREEKKKCDRDMISLAEFQQWLKESK